MTRRNIAQDYCIRANPCAIANVNSTQYASARAYVDAITDGRNRAIGELPYRYLLHYHTIIADYAVLMNNHPVRVRKLISLANFCTGDNFALGDPVPE